MNVLFLSTLPTSCVSWHVYYIKRILTKLLIRAMLLVVRLIEVNGISTMVGTDWGKPKK